MTISPDFHPRSSAFIGGLLCCLFLLGCKAKQAAPDYDRPLLPGQAALRLVPPSAWPDLTGAVQTTTDDLTVALDRSIKWFDAPSSRKHFPIEGVSYEQARMSVRVFARLVKEARSPGELQRTLQDHFNLYQSVGWDGSGEVLFTGYYAPVLPASRTRTGKYQFPLYRRPADLVSDPVTGEIMGRQVGSTVVSYSTRAQLEKSGELTGLELVYLNDKFDCYIAQVQGSAKLSMIDGGTMYVGYAGSNGHEYTSISKQLVKEGKLRENELSLASVRAFFRRHPEAVDKYTQLNDRFIFMREYTGETWPAGSLGFKVTNLRTVATDKSVFPRGGVMLVDTAVYAPSGGQARLFMWMMDQDTGGAIRAPGRADLFMGVGPEAELMAGRQYAVGSMYYLFLKPERVADWAARLASPAS